MFWNYTIDNGNTCWFSKFIHIFSFIVEAIRDHPEKIKSDKRITIKSDINVKSNLKKLLFPSEFLLSFQIWKNPSFKSTPSSLPTTHCHYQVFDPFKLLSWFPNMTKYITHFPNTILLGPYDIHLLSNSIMIDLSLTC